MQSQKQIPIEGLLERYENALGEMGYTIMTKMHYVKRADIILHRHLSRNLKYFDQAIAKQYADEIDERYFNGELRRHYYDGVKREIERFVSYVCSGKSEALPNPLRGVRQKLTPTYEKIAGEFLTEDFHPNTCGDARWIAHKYFAWLEEQGFTDLSGVGAVHIQKFMLVCSKQYAPSTMYDVQLYLKKLYRFLHIAGYTRENYEEFFSFKVNRDKKVFPVLPKSDIAKLLDAIDRTTPRGKRDYAIMLLGTVLGLRACDVAAMKLADIDWIRGEIRILQSKTSHSVILPLTQDVGEALKDYILNARPKSSDQEIFLRICAPHTNKSI